MELNDSIDISSKDFSETNSQKPGILIPLTIDLALRAKHLKEEELLRVNKSRDVSVDKLHRYADLIVSSAVKTRQLHAGSAYSPLAYIASRRRLWSSSRTDPFEDEYIKGHKVVICYWLTESQLYQPRVNEEGVSLKQQLPQESSSLQTTIQTPHTSLSPPLEGKVMQTQTEQTQQSRLLEQDFEKKAQKVRLPLELKMFRDDDRILCIQMESREGRFKKASITSSNVK